jgi:hypothetical protein
MTGCQEEDNNKSVLTELIYYYCCTFVGRDSSVGIATGYGLDGLGIESGWGEIFRTSLDRPWGPPSLLYNGYRVFPGIKSVRSVTLTIHPF